MKTLQYIITLTITLTITSCIPFFKQHQRVRMSVPNEIVADNIKPGAIRIIDDEGKERIIERRMPEYNSRILDKISDDRKVAISTIPIQTIETPSTSIDKITDTITADKLEKPEQNKGDQSSSILDQRLGIDVRKDMGRQGKHFIIKKTKKQELVATDADSEGSFTVIVVTFSSKRNATILAKKFAQRYPSTAIPIAEGRKDAGYRVELGPFSHKKEAETALKEMRQSGYLDAEIVEDAK